MEQFQLGLWEPVVQPHPEGSRRPGASLAEQFWAFHRANPHVYDELRRLALGLRRRGVEKWGIAGLFEVLRWQRRMETDDESGFKLNNVYRAFYARLLMDREPLLEGFFDLRVQTSQRLRKAAHDVSHGR